jgi:hypothetical protein
MSERMVLVVVEEKSNIFDFDATFLWKMKLMCSCMNVSAVTNYGVIGYTSRNCISFLPDAEYLLQAINLMTVRDPPR